MAAVTSEAISEFTRVTGVPFPVAQQILLEHRGNLRAALDSHFQQVQRSLHRPSLPATVSPSMLLDPQNRMKMYGQMISGITSFIGGRQPVQQYPTFQSYGPPPPPFGYPSNMAQLQGGNIVNDDEMLRIAIEVSRKEYMEINHRTRTENDDIAAALELSLKIAEQGENKEGESGESSGSSTAQLLSPEPSPENNGAINLMIRMPDGTRHGRHFLKRSRLQEVFDFIDFTASVEQGKYALVRQYPRHVFDVNHKSATLEELGITGRQELLCMEMT